MISVPLSAIGGGFLAAFGEDLYSWSKERLQKITNTGKKTDFDETKINIVMRDCNINA